MVGVRVFGVWYFWVSGESIRQDADMLGKAFRDEGGGTIEWALQSERDAEAARKRIAWETKKALALLRSAMAFEFWVLLVTCQRRGGLENDFCGTMVVDTHSILKHEL